ENLDAMYGLADESTGQWQAFLETLLSIYGESPFTTKDLAQRLQNDNALRDALPADLELNDIPGNFSRRAGKAFSKHAEKRYGERHLRLERDGEEKRATKWCVRYG